MTPENLDEKVSTLASAVVADPRWQANNDELGASVLGMLLYGYALAIGRLTMVLDMTHIDAAVLKAMMAHVRSAEKWTRGMVAAAAEAAFDEQVHPGHFELIGVGHQYSTASPKPPVMVDNVFANISSVRQAASREQRG